MWGSDTYYSECLRAALNGRGLPELPYPSVAGTTLENTGGGRFTSSASDLAAVALTSEAPHQVSGTSPRVNLQSAMPWAGRSEALVVSAVAAMHAAH